MENKYNSLSEFKKDFPSECNSLRHKKLLIKLCEDMGWDPPKQKKTTKPAGNLNNKERCLELRETILIQTIKKLIKENTFRELASEFNCSSAWLNEVVNGKKDPNLNLLMEVARYTGKSYDELMEVYIPINNEKTIDLEINGK
jgi:hypothetical protein